MNLLIICGRTKPLHNTQFSFVRLCAYVCVCVLVYLFLSPCLMTVQILCLCLCHLHWNAIIFMRTAFVLNVLVVICLAFYHKLDLIILLLLSDGESVKGISCTVMVRYQM